MTFSTYLYKSTLPRYPGSQALMESTASPKENGNFWNPHNNPPHHSYSEKGAKKCLSSFSVNLSIKRIFFTVLPGLFVFGMIFLCVYNLPIYSDGTGTGVDVGGGATGEVLDGNTVFNDTEELDDVEVRRRVKLDRFEKMISKKMKQGFDDRDLGKEKRKRSVDVLDEIVKSIKNKFGGNDDHDDDDDEEEEENSDLTKQYYNNENDDDQDHIDQNTQPQVLEDQSIKNFNPKSNQRITKGPKLQSPDMYPDPTIDSLPESEEKPSDVKEKETPYFQDIYIFEASDEEPSDEPTTSTNRRLRKRQLVPLLFPPESNTVDGTPITQAPGPVIAENLPSTENTEKDVKSSANQTQTQHPKFKPASNNKTDTETIIKKLQSLLQQFLKLFSKLYKQKDSQNKDISTSATTPIRRSVIQTNTNTNPSVGVSPLDTRSLIPKEEPRKLGGFWDGLCNFFTGMDCKAAEDKLEEEIKEDKAKVDEEEKKLTEELKQAWDEVVEELDGKKSDDDKSKDNKDSDGSKGNRKRYMSSDFIKKSCS